jgi:DNA helicase-4
VTTNAWSGQGWKITVSDTEVIVAEASGPISVPGTAASRLDVRRRWFRWSLRYDGRQLVRLRAVRRADASTLTRALRRLALAPAIAEAIGWHTAVTQLLATARIQQRWVPTEAVDALLATRPKQGLLARVRAAGLEPSLTGLELKALLSLDTNMETLVSGANKEIVAAELSSLRGFFDTIETSPLTDEQAEAVVCFDNRVQVLAAAGSGKTSVMVARAAYAVSRGFVAADRILLLAFNKAAATELQDRIVARFAAAGLDSSGVRSSTFHAFGLDLIGRATGVKPRLARWLDQGEDVQMVLCIVNELRETSETFRYRWGLYRALFANAPTRLDENEPDGYDRATGQTGYRTFAGEIVKSHGERLIANFLYLNRVSPTALSQKGPRRRSASTSSGGTASSAMS